MNKPDAPFYLGVKHTTKKNYDKSWFKANEMGVKKLNRNLTVKWKQWLRKLALKTFILRITTLGERFSKKNHWDWIVKSERIRK